MRVYLLFRRTRSRWTEKQLVGLNVKYCHCCPILYKTIYNVSLNFSKTAIVSNFTKSALLFSSYTGTTKQTPRAFFALFRWNFKTPGPYVGLSSIRNNGQEISYQSWDRMRKDNKDYVQCKKIGRNSKLNSNTLLEKCMFQMRKTASLHTDYDSIRLTANLLNLWPVKDCCRLRSAVTQVCQMLPMFRWNVLLPSSSIPKRR
jgi:hypothetical protein